MSREISNPLQERHEGAGAEFQDWGALPIASTFGDPEAEYAAIRKSAALLDQPQRGALELSGKDRLPFLNNLLTNQTWDKNARSGLAAGTGVYAFFLQRNGRIAADMNVIERGDRTLLEMDARYVEPIRSMFDKYLFGEQVTLTDRVGSLHHLAIHGPEAADVLGEAAGAAPADLPPLGSAQLRLFDVDATVWRDDPAGVPGYHLIVAAADVGPIWDELLARFGQSTAPGKRRLRPAGWAAFNATRIEGGRPIFGIDFDDTVLPHETGQIARAVSFTKGCYLGQEIVARMHARGQFARQIAGIRMADDALPIAGAAVYDGADNQVGGITSSTVSPVLSGAAVCLALLKKAFTAVGTVVRIPAEGQIRTATVVELPFLR